MLDNAAIAELLIREEEAADGHREQASRRAAHNAFMWPEEAADIVPAGRSLTELVGIGPSLNKRLQGWIESNAGEHRTTAGTPRVPHVRCGLQGIGEESYLEFEAAGRSANAHGME